MRYMSQVYLHQSDSIMGIYLPVKGSLSVADVEVQWSHLRPVTYRKLITLKLRTIIWFICETWRSQKAFHDKMLLFANDYCILRSPFSMHNLHFYISWKQNFIKYCTKNTKQLFIPFFHLAPFLYSCKYSFDCLFIFATGTENILCNV